MKTGNKGIGERENYVISRGTEIIKRMNISRDFLQIQKARGQIQSGFDRAVNLSFQVEGEERLITLLRGDGALLPDSILMSDHDFCRIIKNLKCDIIIKNGILYIGTVQLYLKGMANQSLYLPGFINRFCEKGLEERISFLTEYQKSDRIRSDLERLPGRYRNALVRLAIGYVEQEKADVGQAFATLAGVGRGLTPSGDDAVLGALAMICAFDKQIFLTREGSFQEFSSVIINRLLDRKVTTKVSAKYLKCACRSRFSEALCKVAVWIVSGGKAPGKWLDQIMETGHTSGVDMLYGMETASRVIYKKLQDRR